MIACFLRLGLILKSHISLVWWPLHTISVLGRWSQKDQEFKVSLYYMKHCLGHWGSHSGRMTKLPVAAYVPSSEQHSLFKYVIHMEKMCWVLVWALHLFSVQPSRCHFVLDIEYRPFLYSFTVAVTSLRTFSVTYLSMLLILF